MRVVQCPVCEGRGLFNGKTCHGCNGKGWVQIDEFDAIFNAPKYPWSDKIELPHVPEQYRS